MTNQDLTATFPTEKGLRLHIALAAAEGWGRDPRWESPVCLYRYFDPDLTLLYVGISNQFEDRDLAHFKSKAWRVANARWIFVEHFPTRRIAEHAEDKAIAEEAPTDNVKRLTPTSPYCFRNAWFLEETGGLLVGKFRLWLDADWINWWQPPTTCECPKRNAGHDANEG